ncbi:hypothetical protein M0638_20795 [Roseomonas sp. NAR14]|uniref:EAL domain-containing protein n=1 Tax=Roseomonas acroporae TaxID=2937791 RepID=A0A9X1Y9W4_9PROT|nr:hypothetical protein [Roseomonas acroporae]MCK8786814.1 hypothetical protein [Roseomonas acroporae]
MRQVLRQPEGRTALRVRLGEAPPQHRRMAQALLLGAALRGLPPTAPPPRSIPTAGAAAGAAAGASVQPDHAAGEDDDSGGRLFDLPAGEALLLGLPAPVAERLCGLLDRLLGAAAREMVTLWTLPGAAAPLRACAEAASRPGAPPAGRPASPARIAPPRESEAWSRIGALDTELERVPLPPLCRRHAVLRLAGGPPGLAAQRLVPQPDRLAERLAVLRHDPALLRHAGERLARLLPSALALPAGRLALLGAADGVTPLLDLPAAEARRLAAEGPDAAAPGTAALGTAALAGLPPAIGVELSEAADPDALATLRDALARRGWALAVHGLSAAALRLIAPESIAADWLRLAWSAALADRPAALALRRLDPARLILEGCDDPVALEWGREHGIGLFEGRQPERLAAAARRAACPRASGCTVAQCAGRAAAASPAGRAGCGEPGLLAAFLPSPLPSPAPPAGPPPPVPLPSVPPPAVPPLAAQPPAAPSPTTPFLADGTAGPAADMADAAPAPDEAAAP